MQLPRTKVFWKEFLGGRRPKWHPGHPVLLPGVLGACSRVRWSLGHSSCGEQGQANQGVLKPKGSCMSPAEQCHMQAAQLVPKVWPSSLVTRHLGKANNSADNTEIATCLNSWQTVGKVTLFCTMPRDKGLAV